MTSRLPYPRYLELDNDWIPQAIEDLIAEIEAYLAKWARFLDLKGGASR